MSEGRVTVGDRDLPAEIKVLADEIAMLWTVIEMMVTEASPWRGMLPSPRWEAIQRMRKRMEESGDE